jgi:hypothetical protein
MRSRQQYGVKCNEHALPFMMERLIVMAEDEIGFGKWKAGVKRKLHLILKGIRRKSNSNPLWRI